MIWLTWRQHRLQALSAAVGLALIALFLVPTGLQMRDTFDTLGLPKCLARLGHPAFVAFDQGCQPVGEEFAGRYQTLALVSALLLFLPLLAGLFWGAPLVAREVEQGTHRFVWTQGVTRTRWAAAKLGLVGGGVLLFAGAYALLMSWWIAPLNAATGYRFTWLFFDQQGVVLLAYVLFALALGVFAGVVTRKVLAAMAVTLIGFMAMRLVVALLVRPHFQPLRRRAYPIVSDTEPNPLAGDWIVSRAVHGAGGVKLTPGSGTQALCPTDAPAACANQYGAGAYNLETFHPAHQFWLFQWLETALYVGVAALLVLGAVHWIRRRLA